MKAEDIKPLNDFVQNYLTPYQDIELIILKGHIMLEYTLNKFISVVSQRPEEFDENIFSFVQKVEIVKFLSPLHYEVLDRAILLNKLRNGIAHRLHHDPKHLQTFLGQAAGQYKIVKATIKSDKAMALKCAIRNMCIELNYGMWGTRMYNNLQGHLKTLEELDKKASKKRVSKKKNVT